MNEITWNNVSLQELSATAAEMLRLLVDAPTVWRFDGAMGAGKTTFIKQICQQLGVLDRVQSPTFSLVNEYETAEGETVYHFDFYRLESPQEALAIGATEYFDSGSLCLIEWPERVEALLPGEYVKVLIQTQPNDSRTIQLTIHGTTQ